MRKKLFIILSFLLSMFLLQSCSERLPIETDMNETVASFSFTTQDETTLSLEDLKGSWWIADFVFTNCTTVCLPMTANMSQLQDQIQEEDLPVQLISFSVDPDFDSPEVLKEYGEEYEADFSSWSFLTGYDFDTIRELSIKSFRALLQAPDFGSDQVTHDTRFFLVNPKGKIVKGYDGVKNENITLIMEDLQKLDNANLLQ